MLKHEQLGSDKSSTLKEENNEKGGKGARENETQTGLGKKHFVGSADKADKTLSLWRENDSNSSFDLFRHCNQI